MVSHEYSARCVHGNTNWVVKERRRAYAVDGADIDGADGELVGVGVFVAGDDVANDDVVEFGSAGADDLLDLKAEKSDRARNIIGRDTGEIDVGLKPVE